MVNNQCVGDFEMTDFDMVNFEIEEVDNVEALSNEAYWWAGLGVAVVVGIAAC